MKLSILVLASLWGIPAYAASGINIGDLTIILNDAKVRNEFAANSVVKLNSAEIYGPVPPCGRNSPVTYELTVEKQGEWKPCKVLVLVAAPDGKCHRGGPREASLVSGIICDVNE